MPGYERTLTVAAVFVQACAASDPSTAEQADVVISDSLGVTVVTSHVPVRPSGSWRLGQVVTAIGAVEGDSTQILGDPVAAMRLASGKYAIADRMTNEIRVYDAGGEHVVTHGRGGAGPGEYRSLWSLLPYRGDSLIAGERGGRRLSVLAPDGSFVRTITPRLTFDVRRSGGRPEQSCCALVGTRDGELIFAYPGIIPEGGLGVRRSTVTIVRLEADGTFLDTLGGFDSAEYRPAPRGSRTPTRRVQLSSSVSAVAADTALYVSSGRVFEIRELAPNGALRRIIRLARDPEPINDAIETRYRAVLDSMLDKQAERMPEFAAETRSQRQIVAETPFHKTLPAISMMRIDRSGNLWVTGLHSWWSRASEDPWEVFDRTGRWLTTVLVPQHLRVLEIGEKYVIAAVRDELDVPFIHVYQLQKS